MRRQYAGIALATLLSGMCLAPVTAQQTVGLFQNGESSFDGYTLFGPLTQFQTFLIDNRGART